MTHPTVTSPPTVRSHGPYQPWTMSVATLATMTTMTTRAPIPARSRGGLISSRASARKPPDSTASFTPKPRSLREGSGSSLPSVAARASTDRGDDRPLGATDEADDGSGGIDLRRLATAAVAMATGVVLVAPPPVGSLAGWLGWDISGGGVVAGVELAGPARAGGLPDQLDPWKEGRARKAQERLLAQQRVDAIYQVRARSPRRCTRHPAPSRRHATWQGARRGRITLVPLPSVVPREASAALTPSPFPRRSNARTDAVVTSNKQKEAETRAENERLSTAYYAKATASRRARAAAERDGLPPAEVDAAAAAAGKRAFDEAVAAIDAEALALRDYEDRNAELRRTVRRRRDRRFERAKRHTSRHITPCFI